MSISNAAKNSIEQTDYLDGNSRVSVTATTCEMEVAATHGFPDEIALRTAEIANRWTKKERVERRRISDAKSAWLLDLIQEAEGFSDGEPVLESIVCHQS